LKEQNDNLKHRSDIPDGVKELRMLTEGEYWYWVKESLQLKREMTIYPETLTPEQQQQLNQIEQELLEMACEASEERRTITVLKGK
jgi:hypothetical protein